MDQTQNGSAAVHRKPDGSVEIEMLGQHGQSERYSLAPLEVEDYQVIRDRLQERRIDPMVAVVEQLDGIKDLPASLREQVRKELFDRLYQDLKALPQDRVPTPEEVGHWVDRTEAGAGFTIYLMLRRQHPDITEERALEIMKSVGKAEFLRVREEANQRLIARAERLAKAANLPASLREQVYKETFDL